MKSLTSLWSCVANELATRCRTSATRDIITVTRRVEHEGLSFLAITLANYGKATEKWLDQGFVAPWDVASFKKHRLTGLPLFLGGFLGRVFDPVSGVLLDDPDINAIEAIRELTLMFGKIAPPPDPSREGKGDGVVTPRRFRRAMSEYIQCEQDVRDSDARLDPAYMADFRRVSELLFGNLFAKMDRDVQFGRLIPKHGPGAVADRLSSNAKYDLRTWTARLNEHMPAEEFLIPSLHFREDLEKELNILEPGQEIPVRVTAVPKTLKTPRIIAIEPTAMQFTQQAILRSFRDSLLEDSFLSRIIGIEDQVPNQVLAQKGSLSGDLATLDLSEASDRVSYQHVRAMLADYPALLWAVDATRSRKADVPGHGIIRMAKFAPMGSALCFPMESLVFMTLIFLGIERELSAPLSRRTMINRFGEQVRVFGDDLIVPRDHVLSVIDELENFGFRVNVDKSFWTGRYRESCGREYYDGSDVSIVRVREVLPTSRRNASGVIATVALRNRFYWAGLWTTAAYLDKFLEKLLKAYPVVSPSSPLLGRESVLGYRFQTISPRTYSPLAKGWFTVAKSPLDHLEGVGALHKCLLRTADQSAQKMGLPGKLPSVSVASVDDEHLERTGRPERVDIKLGWRSPF